MLLLLRLLTTALLLLLCSAPLFSWLSAPALVALTVFFLLFNLRPSWERRPGIPRRLKIMMGGYELFMTSAWLSVAILGLYLVDLPHIISTTGVSAPRALWSIALTLLLLFLLLANGFFRIVFTSTRLRLALRVLLICLWWCPVVNFFLLWRACALVKAEYRFDLAKQECNALRKENEVCATRYPILLVHGIFFRDWQLINYWGRIPKELTRNGAVLYYGEQQSSAAVAESAAELRDQIQKIIAETGCGKVNIIAHSKGGLDSRYAISHLGMDRYVASLTTINTPHRGCVFAQELMDRLPASLVRWIGIRYNAIFQKLGDLSPNFIAGVTDLRADACARFNEDTPDRPGILYQSVMSTMRKAGSAPFPLNLTYPLVKKYDREANDGLVTLSSAKWGDFLGNQTVSGRRGISHGDIIDLMREDIDGFDVREFYVSLVKDLKDRGY